MELQNKNDKLNKLALKLQSRNSSIVQATKFAAKAPAIHRLSHLCYQKQQ